MESTKQNKLRLCYQLQRDSTEDNEVLPENNFSGLLWTFNKNSSSNPTELSKMTLVNSLIHITQIAAFQ